MVFIIETEGKPQPVYHPPQQSSLSNIFTHLPTYFFPLLENSNECESFVLSFTYNVCKISYYNIMFARRVISLPLLDPRITEVAFIVNVLIHPTQAVCVVYHKLTR